LRFLRRLTFVSPTRAVGAARKVALPDDSIAAEITSQTLNCVFDRGSTMPLCLLQISELDKLCDYRVRRNRSPKVDDTPHERSPQTPDAAPKRHPPM
jgi:hypothetical protein